MPKIWNTYTFDPRYTEVLSSLSEYPKDKVICIMPCYNAQDTIGKAIESVINQSHPNWHLIIVDDASTDKSVKVIKKYLKDPRIDLLRNKTNRGCYYSRNRALYHVKDRTWSFFTTHDADDTSTDDRFSIFINNFYNNACDSIIGVYNGKRWEVTDNKPKLKYIKSQNSVGTAWYTYEVFKTLGFYYSNRFGCDSEYKERMLRIIAGTVPQEDFNQKVRDTMIYLSPEYAYTYTTGVAPVPSLTQKYNLSERRKFAKDSDDRIKTFTTLKDFYYNFEPHPEDIKL